MWLRASDGVAGPGKSAPSGRCRPGAGLSGLGHALVAGLLEGKFPETPRAIERALAAFPVLLPRRTTFYGATEVGYREPGGHAVTFAQFSGSDPDPA